MVKKYIKRIIAMFFAALMLTGIVAYAANYGTSSDPLVTLSYLTDVFKASVMSDVDSKISTAESDLTKSFTDKLSSAGVSSGSSFSVVTVADGKTLVCEPGTQILLRLGTVKCVSTYSPGLVDTTTAGSINNGTSLTANHMYLVTISGNGIKASGSATILISGTYSIK